MIPRKTIIIPAVMNKDMPPPAVFDPAAKGSGGGGLILLSIGALSGSLMVFGIGLLESWCIRC